MILSVDTIVNTILFIVRRDEYLQWCINSTSGNLDNVLFQEQLAPLLVNGTQKFSSSMNDFYNCRRTWEGELKFSVLSTIVMVTIYVRPSFFFCVARLLILFNYRFTGQLAFFHIRSKFV